MKRYLIMVFIVGLMLLSGCEKREEDRVVKGNYVVVDRDHTDRKILIEMKEDNDVKINLELLGKICEKENELVIETSKCTFPVPEEFKDFVALDDEVKVVFNRALVKAYTSNTVRFSYDDIYLYKIVSAEELLEQYECQKCKTYYVISYPKGECTLADYTYGDATGYYVQSMNFSFLENRSFAYDYIKKEYCTYTWCSDKIDDELQDVRRLQEVKHNASEISDYKLDFQEYYIVY